MFARWLTRTRWGAGEEVGAANVVKLGGNFLIASAIEAMAESLALAEANGVDRVAMMEMLNSTIFDCLIYKGYGQRVSERDHLPYPDAHFALELGLKDVSLVSATAAASSTPMPLCSLLKDRYLSAQASGWGELDWSSIGEYSPPEPKPDPEARACCLVSDRSMARRAESVDGRGRARR